MTDAEIRGRLLAHFHALRHSNGGWVPISDLMLAPEPVELRVIGGVCQQLADTGLIQWKGLQDSNGFVAGMAKITGQGVAAVESGRSPSIDIQFPSKGRIAPCAPPIEADPWASTHPELTLVPAMEGPLQSAPQQAVVGAQPEILQLKPAFMGVGVDLKALWRRYAPIIVEGWRKRRS